MTHGTFKYVALLILSSCVITPLAYAQTTLYVDDDAGEGNIGQSWLTPFNDLEDALLWAREHPIITEIHVAGGVYVPSEESESGVSRSKTFQLVNGLALLGGHAGVADPGDPDVRDLELYESILSGDLAGNDTSVACTEDSPECDSWGGRCVNYTCILQENRSENSYHVVTAYGTDDTAVLDGFTITAGNATGARNGGGIDIDDGSPSIANCRIIRNMAGDSGGGVSMAGSGASIADCVISLNAAVVVGGGARCHLQSNPTITRTEISYNTAISRPDDPLTGHGGGLYCSANSDPVILDSIIMGNRAVSGGGGGIVCYDSSPEIVGGEVFDNEADQCGGGLGFNAASNATVHRVSIRHNTAYHEGGGIHCSHSNPTIAGCEVTDNTTGRSGGGMHSNTGSPTVTNCTFTRNAAGGSGGGMYFNGGSGDVANCIVWGNTASQAPEILATESTPTVTYCCVQGGYSGIGNFSADPRLRDPDGSDDVPGNGDDDLQLLLVSPCIDVGDNSAVPPDMIVDLAGNPRVVDAPQTPDTGHGASPLVDIGAYEFQERTQGDLDGDGDVDLGDFKLFLESFGGPLLNR